MSEPKSMTAEDLREQARRIRADGEPVIRDLRALVETARQSLESAEYNLRIETDKIEKRASAIERAARTLDEIDSGLSSGFDSATIAAMEASQIAASVENRRTGRQMKSKGPVATIARALGVSMTELAKMAKFAGGTVRAWDTRGKIPEDAKPRFDALLKAHAAASAAPKKTAKPAR